MERGKKKSGTKVILTADYHLRENAPACRLDDFEKAQWAKLDFISELQRKYDCPIWHSGDFFDHWKPSPSLLAKTIQHLPKQFHTIYGNHDLPQHSMELKDKCGVYVLEQAGVLSIIDSNHWGLPFNKFYGFTYNGQRVLVWHVMTYQGKTPYPGCTDSPAMSLIRKNKDFDLILTGHNHQQFIEECEGRLLINPGCITRQESDMQGFEPHVILWDSADNTYETIPIPHEKGVVTVPKNVQDVQARNKRIDAFVTTLQSDWDNGVDFEKNIERALEANEISEETKKIVYKSLDVQ